jgi:hypothetical protein
VTVINGMCAGHMGTAHVHMLSYDSIMHAVHGVHDSDDEW